MSYTQLDSKQALNVKRGTIDGFSAISVTKRIKLTVQDQNDKLGRPSLA